MKRCIDRLLQSYGSRVELWRGGKVTEVRAFLQPVTSKSWQNMEHMFAGIGEIPRGQYLYIGPAEVPVLECDYLALGDKRYQMCRCDTLMIGDTALYLWGLCVEGGYDEPWNG